VRLGKALLRGHDAESGNRRDVFAGSMEERGGQEETQACRAVFMTDERQPDAGRAEARSAWPLCLRSGRYAPAIRFAAV
jgi:hypothetical protein